MQTDFKMSTEEGELLARQAQKASNHSYKFSNWSETYSCQPEVYFEPRSVPEVKAILSVARQQNKHVRVIGGGSSPSDLCLTEDFMVNLKHFNKIIQIDSNNHLVTVEAGIIVSDLNNQLNDHNLAISVLGSVDFVSLGGCMSTGTHGSGVDFNIIAQYVESFDMILASGEERHVARDTSPDLFRAAVLSLGTIGIITAVTLRVEDAFRLEHIQQPSTLNHVLDNLDVYTSMSDHFRFIWFPHTDDVTMWHTKRTKKPKFKSDSWFWDYLIGFHLLQFCFYISTFIPFIVPWISRFFYSLLYTTPRYRVDDSFKIFRFECLFHQYVNEYSILRDKTADSLLDLKSWLKESGFPAHFPVEVRFVKGDDIILSPANGRDSCYINIVMFRPYNKSVNRKEYWAAFESIMKKYNGRPHWAKAYDYSTEEFASTYKDWPKFTKIREELDPGGMFLNENTKKLFAKN